MQAIPSIPGSPQISDAPVESATKTENTTNENFIQHLFTASHKIDPAEKNDIQVDKSHTDGSIERTEENAGMSVGEINLVNAALQNPLELGQIVTEEVNTVTPALPDRQFIAQEMTAVTLSGTDKVVQISSFQDTFRAPEIPIRQEINGEQAKLSSIPAQTTTVQSFPDRELGVTFGQNHNRPELTIENWSAQFSYQRSTDIDDPQRAETVNTQVQKNGVVLLREPVLTTVSPELEQVAAPAHGKSGSGVEVPRQPQDINSNFIHSNLPGVSTKTNTDTNTGSQQQAGQDGQPLAQDSASANGPQSPVMQTGQETPPVFSPDQAGSSGLIRSGQETTTSLSLHLPSGIEIPHSRIVDQVVDRFTLNRKLETGTITLRLHPAELGELRMEIKVEQDNIKAHITTQNPQVQDILDRNLPRLREALAQQGMNLEHMQVT
ncbi:MAG TPA: flagellar hook-length control protein FliK, partial [Desulfobulbaceae bacterium]|nr:flagellar hook-length control protein FliK [Desulfobulbaceae bacterium]